MPGTSWSLVESGNYNIFATKTDGTLWAVGGAGGSGQLAQNNRTNYSSPVQIPGTTWIYGQSAIDRWRTGAQAGIDNSFCIKEIT